jgi:hypothetical protein
VKQSIDGPTVPASYMVDYEALTELLLLWVPQTIRMAGGATCIDNAPNTSSMAMSRTFCYRTSQGKGLRGVCTVATLSPTA